jgi:translation initiation factor eIF-2B subunit alpha
MNACPLARVSDALPRCARRYVTRTAALDLADLVMSKAWLIERGNTFAETSLKARAKIAELGECFIRDGSVVMTHGNSRVVMALLKRAAAQGKHFSVVVRCTGLRVGGRDSQQRDT